MTLQGYYNTAIGCYTVTSNTTGSMNIAYGSKALYNYRKQWRIDKINRIINKYIEKI